MQKYCNSACHHLPWLTVHQELRHIQETRTGCATQLIISRLFVELPRAKFCNVYRYLTAGMLWCAALIRRLQNIQNSASANCLVAPATGLRPLPLYFWLTHVVHRFFWCSCAFLNLCWSFTFTSPSFEFLMTLHSTAPGLSLGRVPSSPKCRLNASLSLSSAYHIMVGTHAGHQDSHGPRCWDLQQIIWGCRLVWHH